MLFNKVSLIIWKWASELLAENLGRSEIKAIRVPASEGLPVVFDCLLRLLTNVPKFRLLTGVFAHILPMSTRSSSVLLSVVHI